MVGASIRQGAHHAALKSTSTGSGLSSTSRANVASVVTAAGIGAPRRRGGGDGGVAPQDGRAPCARLVPVEASARGHERTPPPRGLAAPAAGHHAGRAGPGASAPERRPGGPVRRCLNAKVPAHERTPRRAPDPHRHRHRGHVHRRRRRRRADRADGDHQDAVHARRPGRGVPRRRPQGARPDGPDRGVGHGRQPRDDGRDQPAARGQARPDRLHHHRGLRVGAGDRPPVGARRLRQQLLLGQAAADRAGRPGAHRPRPAGRARRGGPPLRPGRRRRRRAVLPRRRDHHDRRLLPALLRRRLPRAGDARGAARGAARRRGVAVERGAARVPGVRAVGDHAGRRRGQAAGRPPTSPTSAPGSTRSRPACRST